MDYISYYCAQAKRAQKGEGLPIQGINQLEPSNLDFLPQKTIVKKSKRKVKVSGQRKKPQVKKAIKRVVSKKQKKKSTKRRKIQKRNIDIFT